MFAIAHTAMAATPVDTLRMKAQDAMVALVMGNTDALDQESLAQWLYVQGKQAETQNPVNAQMFYDNYLTTLISSTIIEYTIPTTYDRVSFWQRITANIKDVQRFAIKYAEQLPELRQTLYNYELFSKSLQLRSVQIIEKKLANIGSPELTDSWKTTKEHREALEITNSFIRESQPGIDAIRTSVLPADTAKVYEFERIKTIRDQLDIAVRSSETHIISEIYRRDTTGVSAEMYFDWKVVQNALNKDNAVVEYMACPDENGNTAYYAIVLTREMDYPAIVSIAAEDQLRDCLEDKINYGALYELLWRPLEPLLENSTEIYVIPAGMIHRVPFAGLYDRKGFLYDRYSIHHLLSGRDVIEHRKDDIPFKQKNALLVGGADYDILATADSTTNDTVNIHNGAELTVLHDALRASRGQGFGYLPGSLSEVNSIADMLAAKEWSVRTMTDTHATKTEFRKNIALQPTDILHISTHGFCVPTTVEDTSPDRNIYKVSDNPLLRSGLAFSGANLNWKKRDTPYVADDGILTALEVSGLNLTGTELVVLSACGTGLGYVDDGEGIYGLQRAFRLAGADNIVVSLWDIPDKQTSELMVSFYGFIADGYPIKRAFDMAIKQARGKYPDRPDFWAGFVLIEGVN